MKKAYYIINFLMGGQFRILDLGLRAEKGENLRLFLGRYEFVFELF